jgi:hypothetical protein
MTDGLKGIIAQLERQQKAIDQALVALRGVDGSEPTVRAETSIAPPTRKGRMTPEGSKRLSAALRKRWALRKKAAQVAAAGAQKAARRKVRLTPEGRRRLSAAMKRRWAVKRATSA